MQQRAVALAMALPACSGYAHMSSQYGVDWRFAWSMPTASNDEAGLGGGITFAIDDKLCERLLVRFREQSQDTWAAVMNLGIKFVDCAEIYDAINRAFGTWSANHKLLQFKDVTEPCRRAGQPNATDCLHAEVAIDAVNASANLAAYVIDRPRRGGQFSYNPPGRRTTAGVFVAEDATIGYSTMTFNTHQCWYLDNTFCAPLHTLTGDQDLLVRLLLILATFLGLLLLLYWLSVRAPLLLSCHQPSPPTQLGASTPQALTHPSLTLSLRLPSCVRMRAAGHVQ